MARNYDPQAIRARYKALAKKHHPDLNRENQVPPLPSHAQKIE